MIAVALLHDLVEDTEASIEDVQARFGKEIAQGVAWLADVISNPRSIVDHGDGFARVSLRKIASLPEVLSEGH